MSTRSNFLADEAASGMGKGRPPALEAPERMRKHCNRVGGIACIQAWRTIHDFSATIARLGTGTPLS